MKLLGVIITAAAQQYLCNTSHTFCGLHRDGDKCRTTWLTMTVSLAVVDPSPQPRQLCADHHVILRMFFK